MSKKTNKGVRMVKETIKTYADLKEVFTGSIDKIRQGLKDIEDTFGNSYDYLEFKIDYESNYDSSDVSFTLAGFRPETKEEEVIRLNQEEKAREKRLLQLEKDKRVLEKKRADLLRKQSEIAKELTKMGATP